MHTCAASPITSRDSKQLRRPGAGAPTRHAASPLHRPDGQAQRRPAAAASRAARPPEHRPYKGPVDGTAVLSTAPPCTLSAFPFPPGQRGQPACHAIFVRNGALVQGDASGRFCGSSSWWPCPAEPALRDRNRIRRNRVPARARGRSRSSAGDTGRRPPAGAVRSTGCSGGAVALHPRAGRRFPPVGYGRARADAAGRAARRRSDRRRASPSTTSSPTPAGAAGPTPAQTRRRAALLERRPARPLTSSNTTSSRTSWPFICCTLPCGYGRSF